MAFHPLQSIRIPAVLLLGEHSSHICLPATRRAIQDTPSASIQSAVSLDTGAGNSFPIRTSL